jgi:hypothetical protein
MAASRPVRSPFITMLSLVRNPRRSLLIERPSFWRPQNKTSNIRFGTSHPTKIAGRSNTWSNLSMYVSNPTLDQQLWIHRWTQPPLSCSSKRVHIDYTKLILGFSYSCFLVGHSKSAVVIRKTKWWSIIILFRFSTCAKLFNSCLPFLDISLLQWTHFRRI